MRGRPLPFAVRAEASQFLRFFVVGLGGFCVDGGVLLLVIRLLGVDPISGRFLSFAVAVTFTYGLNRAWAFRRGIGLLRGFGLYLGVQGFGFGCNLTVYSALFLLLPKPWNAPLLCLAMASGVALVVNYAGAKWLVFRSSPR